MLNALREKIKDHWRAQSVGGWEARRKASSCCKAHINSKVSCQTGQHEGLLPSGGKLDNLKSAVRLSAGGVRNAGGHRDGQLSALAPCAS